MVKWNKLSGDRLGFIFAMFFLVVLGIFWYNQEADLEKYGECTVGTIDHFGGTLMSCRAYYYFQVNRRRYESYTPISRKYKSLVIPGKKYVVKYERTDPSNSVIFLKVPIVDGAFNSEVPKECCDTLM